MTPDIENQPARPASLLGLPPKIRHRIYLFTGVARFDKHPYTYYLDGGDRESRSMELIGSFPDPPPARHFLGLLLSCRILYAETISLLYSANRFVISYSHHGSLAPLRALTPTALASLTSLKIVLNQSSCHQPTDSRGYPPPCCRGKHLWADTDYCAEHHGGQHRPPLSLDPVSNNLNPDTLAQAMMGEWCDTATYLAPHVGVGRLELSLVCDVDPRALELARLAVAPIALLPRLKNCDIRLGVSWDRPLQRLAEEAVLQGCRTPRPTRTTTSPAQLLTNLPSELRHRILEYTDLITPWKEVTLSRQHRGYQLYHPPCHDFRNRCPPDNHHGCQLSECNTFRPDVSVRRPGCFCRRKHAAFTLTCNCWAPPTDLFLVCRLLCRDAQFVFFSGNRFIVFDHHAMMPWDLPPEQFQRPDPDSVPDSVPDTASIITNPRYYPYERLFASEFLRDIIPVHCLGDLRFLELVFPPYEPHGWPASERAAMCEWRDTADWIRGKVDAPALTISLAMVDFHTEGFSTRANLTKEQETQIYKSYAAIMVFLIPLVREDGLAGIHVQCAFPGRWTQRTIRRMREHRGWLDGAERWVKKNAEAFVRGENASPAAPGPRKSTWQRWYDVGIGCSRRHWARGA